MLNNNIKIALRNLVHHKGLAALNIGGLAVGIACFGLMVWHLRHELSFDRWHSRHERIFRLAMQTEGGSFGEGIAKVPGNFGRIAAEDLPEIDGMARFMRQNEVLVTRGAKRFYERRGMFADSTIFRIFSFQLKKGDPATALSAPGKIVLTESMARKYFGDDDPVGQTLRFDNETERTVSGVLANVPPNAHFRFDFLTSMATYAIEDERHETPSWQQYYTYVLLSSNATAEGVATKFKAALEKRLGPSPELARVKPFLQPLADIHLKSRLHRELEPNGSMQSVGIFAAAALFVLLIAGINFINLTTAFASRRAREVGIRKANGAGRGQLVGQFLGEALLTTFAAALLGGVLFHLAAPGFSQITGSTMATGFSDPKLLTLLAGIWLSVGLAAGIYPAFVLSGFRPGEALKGDVGASNSGAMLRRGLVVFQFALSVFLICAALVVNRQHDFVKNKNLGFQKEQVVVMDIRSDKMRMGFETFKQSLLAHPGVLSASASGNLPGGSDFGIPCKPQGVPDEQIPPFRILVGDHDFLQTFGIKTVSGRDFSRDFGSDSTTYLLNEEAVRQLGWAEIDPLSKTISMPAINRPPGAVVGIVADFHFRSLHERIGPLLFFVPPPQWFSLISVRIRPENIPATLAHMEKQWSVFDPEHPFTYEFLDESFDQLYAREERMAGLVNAVSGLAIFIACLGLFGLAAFAAQRRTKEIGIRKVLGASVAGITSLLAKDFLKLVLIAIVIASPIAYYFMQRWLSDFAYHIDIQWWVFAAAGAAAVVIAFLTVGFQSVQAALANPVKSLKSE